MYKIKQIKKNLKKYLLLNFIIFTFFQSTLIKCNENKYKKLSEQYIAESALEEQSQNPEITFTGVTLQEPSSSVQTKKTKELAREFEQIFEQSSEIPFTGIRIDQPDQENKQFGYYLTFKDVAQENKKSIARKEDPKIPTSTMGDPVAFIKRQRMILLDITERIKKNITFEILGNNEENSNLSPSVIDKTTWRDLELLNGGNDETSEIYIGSILNRANTELGKAYFYGTLARPTARVNVLQQRQKAIKELVINQPELLETLNQQMAGVAQDEGQLLSFWDSKLSLPGVIHNQYFKINKKLDEKLNNSSTMLLLSSLSQAQQKCTNVTLQAGASALLIGYGITKVIEMLLGTQITPDILEKATVPATAMTSPSKIMVLLAALNAPYISCATKVAAGLYGALGLKSALAWSKADLQMDAIVQNKLVSVGKFINKMRQTYEVLAQHPEFTQYLENFANLENVVHGRDPELARLFELFQQKTFESETDWNDFYNRGNPLLAWKLLQDKKVQEKFEKGLAALAEVDMYISIAKLYNEFKDKQVKFSFPTYVTNRNTPLIDLQGYWNPFTNPKDVIKNSSLLGDKKSTRNAIITGPNSAGKSTIMKSITLSLILAQSIGIAPADNMIFTPFTYIASYMETKGSVSDKTSQFQSEIKRAVTLQDTIEDLQKIPGAFSFAIFDELFSGTSPNEGIAIAFATAIEIGRQINSMNILATHYEELTDLDKAEADKILGSLAIDTDYFTNYRVYVERDQNNAIIRPYKIEPGISQQHIALDVAREAGLKGKILNLAQEILQRIESRKKRLF